jgi:hypothetical protein
MPEDKLAGRGQIDKLPAAFIEKKVLRLFYFTLSKLLAKLSRLQLQPFTMTSSDYHISIPHCYLPWPPLTEMIANNGPWLIVVCLGAGWEAPRWPWDRPLPRLKSVSGARFVSVFCAVVLRGGNHRSCRK